MTGWFARSTPVVALVVLVLAVAGCGGSSNPSGPSGPPMTAQAWSSRIHSIFDQLKAAAAPVRTQGHNPQTWFTLSSKLNQMHSEVASLNPPARLRDVNSAIVDGLAPLSGEATKIGNDIKGGSMTSARTDAVTFVRSLFSLLTKIATAMLHAHAGGAATP